MSTEAWFPVPVYISKSKGHEFDTIQKELLDIYSNLDFKQNPSWTSDTHELSVDQEGSFFNECILTQNGSKHFIDFIDSHVRTYLRQIGSHQNSRYVIAQSWFTKTKKGKYAHLHGHSGFDISGVYYLKTNGADGKLFFPNMHRHLASNYIFSHVAPIVNTIPLENGVLALWPSMLLHNTEPNQTDHERVSISFNIKFVYEG